MRSKIGADSEWTFIDSLDVIVEVDSAKTSGADAVTRNKHSIYFILAQCSCLGSTP